MTEKQEKKRRTIEYLYTLLQKVEMGEIDLPSLISACETQGELASYNNPKKNIFRMTLNTHIKYSDEVIEGGFKKLDELRAIIAKKPRTKGLCSDIQKSNLVEVAPLEEYDNTRLALLSAYIELKKLALPLINADSAVYEDYLKHKDKFNKIVGMKLVVGHRNG
jgi:hypothetical protein